MNPNRNGDAQLPDRADEHVPAGAGAGVTLKLEEPMAPPIVVLGEARSGTTLLRYLLDTHPSICCPGENNMVNIVGDMGRFLGSFLDYRPLIECDGAKSTAEIRVASRRLIGGLMNTCLRANRKTVFCSKTVFSRSGDGTWGIDEYDRIFPETRYIAIFRDCLDVVSSAIERQKYGPIAFYKHYYQKAALSSSGFLEFNYVSALTDSWIDKNEKILSFTADRRARSMALRYEDLVAAPEDCMRQVFSFLRVPAHAGVIREAFLRDHPGSQDPKAQVSVAIENRSGKGQKLPMGFLRPGQRERIGELENDINRVVVARTTTQKKPLPPAHLPRVATVTDVFERHLRQCATLNREALGETAIRIQFHVDDDGRKVPWHVAVADRNIEVSAGIGAADSVLRMSSAVLLGIVNREIDMGVSMLDNGEIAVVGKPCLSVLRWLFFRDGSKE